MVIPRITLAPIRFGCGLLHCPLYASRGWAKFSSDGIPNLPSAFQSLESASELGDLSPSAVLQSPTAAPTSATFATRSATIIGAKWAEIIRGRIGISIRAEITSRKRGSSFNCDTEQYESPNEYQPVQPIYGTPVR